MEQNRKKKPGRMTRSEALVTMGTIAAGVPFINGAVNVLGNSSSDNLNSRQLKDPVLVKAINELEYLTPADRFTVQRRGTPVLTELPSESLPSIGLTRETWKLEIIADPESNSQIGNYFSIEKGNAIDWNSLMKMAETKAVRYLHVLACTNSPKLYGMGLWEGVPLRDLIWLTEPKQNIRRVYFNGYHNNDAKQVFNGSLPISRVLEEAPGELPVIVCYKLNGKYLSQANGGPVRVIVPGSYANRSIKWLQRIYLTNSYHANDTYAEANNDVESTVKTCAKFIHRPEKVKSGEKFAVTGMALVGSSGLSKVQYWIKPSGTALHEDDPYLMKGEWNDAIILPPPAKWGSDLPEGKLPPVMQTDPKTGKPITWPIINTIVHWAALMQVNEPGEFELRCRTIDANGIAQPMPRPFGRSGYNRIETAKFVSET